MSMRRREFLAAGAAAVAAVGVGSRLDSAVVAATTQQGANMYGLIGKMIAAPGKRDEIIAILLASTGAMPGCLSYVIATDPNDANAIWITEAWDNEASHKASLTLQSVKDAITKARPFIAGFGERFVTTPVGGHGLTQPPRP